MPIAMHIEFIKEEANSHIVPVAMGHTTVIGYIRSTNEVVKVRQLLSRLATIRSKVTAIVMEFHILLAVVIVRVTKEKEL